MEVCTAVQTQLCQPPLLDIVHANRGSDRLALSNLRIAKKAAVRDDGRQSVHVNDVVDLRIGGCGHVTLSRLVGVPQSSR